MKQKQLAALLIVALMLAAFAGCAERTDGESSESGENSILSVEEEESVSQEESEEEPEQELEEESGEALQSEPEIQLAAEPQTQDASDSAASAESQADTAQAAQQGQSAAAVIYASYDFGALAGYSPNRQGRVGTQEELDSFKAYVAGLSADSVTVLSASAMPNDYSGAYTLSADELAEVIGLLKAMEPALLPEEELGNPYTGGGWTIYIDAPQGSIMCGYTGWFYVDLPNSGDTLIFRADQAQDSFVAVSNYIWAKMEG